MPAMESHSMEYACWGSLAGGFCEKEKISAASPFDRCSFNLFRQSPGSSSSLPSHSSSWMTATLIHSPLDDYGFPVDIQRRDSDPLTSNTDLDTIVWHDFGLMQGRQSQRNGQVSS